MQNIGQIMKQAQQMQARMKELQEKLAGVEISGQAGGGLVSVVLNGKGDARKISISPAAVDPSDIEMLEDLVLAAFNDAKAKVEAHIAGETQKIMGGMGLPAGLPF
ncbi:MAG TPA: YbaB/EbfC family nucleoid-associated protein [Rhodospirillaceae bacterium]|nr:MAG: nucleoid-associated protein, YbaB/EbfC family [Alphaproteobacteria bacterium GWF2_58_20]HAU29636.1 YbaB/EbfC family nucleoid-associated protein [Rhodospirillaceae bacterium]